MEEYKKLLKLAAYLLEYPSEAWWQDFDAYRAAAAEIETKQAREVLEELFDYAQELGNKAYEEQYVRSFEFSPNTNLYLTTQDRTDFGKQASEMHVYKQLFLNNGFDTQNELPDYLPALLELAAALPEEKAAEVFRTMKDKLKLLRDRFIEAKLAYAFLLDVVLMQAERWEGDAA